MPNFLEIITAEQWAALLWITLASLAATNVAKALWRISPLSGETAAKLNAFAFLLGVVFAYFLWPLESSVPWWIAGLVSGLLSPVAYKVLDATLLSRLPAVDAAVNYDRRKADPSTLPPTGMLERRK